MVKGFDKIKIYQQTFDWFDTGGQIVCDPKLLRLTKLNNAEGEPESRFQLWF